jgi:hypothetical protein
MNAKVHCVLQYLATLLVQYVPQSRPTENMRSPQKHSTEDAHYVCTYFSTIGVYYYSSSTVCRLKITSRAQLASTRSSQLASYSTQVALYSSSSAR